MERNSAKNLIKAPVGSGKGAINSSKDVKIIKYLLNIIYAPNSPLTVETGHCDPVLVDRIRTFQKNELNFRICDGRVDPGGKSLTKMIEMAKSRSATKRMISAKSAPVMMGGAWCGNNLNGSISNILDFISHKKDQVRSGKDNESHRAIVDNFLTFYTSPHKIKEEKIRASTTKKSSSTNKLTDNDYKNAAKVLGNDISVNLIKAFAIVESGGRGGFNSEGLPIIAFEGHIFRNQTKRIYDTTHPLLSYPYMKKAGSEWQSNNKDQKSAWKTLKEAMTLDVNAALNSCSWGMFQVMGFNHTTCGYSTVHSFVEAMKSGESGQLMTFVEFCKKTRGLIDAMKRKDFTRMATLYNGPDYGTYNIQIEMLYKKLDEEGKK